MTHIDPKKRIIDKNSFNEEINMIAESLLKDKKQVLPKEFKEKFEDIIDFIEVTGTFQN